MHACNAREEQLVVTNKSVEFEKYPFDVQDFQANY